MYDYSKLLGRIQEKYGNMVDFVKAWGVTYPTFIRRIRGELAFTQDDIEVIIQLLKIPRSHITQYFFKLQVAENVTERS